MFPALFAATSLVLAGCSLSAPPPTSPSQHQVTNNTTDGSAEAEKAVGLAPAPTVISEDFSVSPGSPVNFVALTPIPMAFIWYGRTDLDDVPVTLSKVGTASRLDFDVPELGITCDGLLRFDGTEGYGDWEIFCSDTSEAAGILVPVAGQPTINGQGIDRFNRSVIFSIPLRN